MSTNRRRPQPADIEAESQQKLLEIHEEAKKNVWVEKKAPIGIRVFTWYLFCRAGIYALLLAFLATFPQSGPSTWLVGTMGHFLPGTAAREKAALQREQLKKQSCGLRVHVARRCYGRKGNAGTDGSG